MQILTKLSPQNSARNERFVRSVKLLEIICSLFYKYFSSVSAHDGPELSDEKLDFLRMQLFVVGLRFIPSIT